MLYISELMIWTNSTEEKSLESDNCTIKDDGKKQVLLKLAEQLNITLKEKVMQYNLSTDKVILKISRLPNGQT